MKTFLRCVKTFLRIVVVIAILNLLVLIISLFTGYPLSAQILLDVIVLIIGFGGLYLIKFLRNR